MYKIAVLVSGGGTNLQAIIDAIENEYLRCEISIVISDRNDAYAIQRAENKGIKTEIVSRKEFKVGLSDKIDELIPQDVNLIVLAGFLSILKGKIIERFKNRIINVHPSLIPAFCGDGMYGIKVHQAAVNYGVKLSGSTVHIVDSGTDSGPIVLQKAVEVDCNDTAEDLQKKILKYEHQIFVEAIKCFSENRINVNGRVVEIKKEVHK